MRQADMPVPAPRRTRGAGFTLIEMLVVISIIVVLVSILLPALSQAREAGRSVKCLANLRSIGMGLQKYMTDESKGLLPRVRPLNDGANTNDPSLLDVMSKYLDAALPVKLADNDWVVPDPWRCPSDRGSADEATQFKPLWQYNGTSYEYVPAFVMVVAETLTVREVQFGCTKAFEQSQPPLPLVIDADDWHNPRFNANKRADLPQDARWKRNAMYFGDYHAGQAQYVAPEQIQQLVADTVRFGGLGG
jgi:prepilin-type N-terminal cleavage/methylation domain-containing protein